MACIEIAWIRDGNKFRHIDPQVADLVGWTVEEIMGQPMGNLILDCQGFVTGCPGKVAAKTFPVTLQHRAGNGVHCEAVIICRYNQAGGIAEAWGMIRQMPQHELFTEFVAWWKDAIDEARQSVVDGMTLHPAPAMA